jgi:hypothetical protein
VPIDIERRKAAGGGVLHAPAAEDDARGHQDEHEAQDDLVVRDELGGRHRAGHDDDPDRQIGLGAVHAGNAEIFVCGNRRDDAGDDSEREDREEQNGRERGRREDDPADHPRHLAPITAGEGGVVMPPYLRSRFW